VGGLRAGGAWQNIRSFPCRCSRLRPTHIITWAADESAAGNVVREAYPSDKVIRMTKRPRDTWVISKGALGLTNKRVDVCTVARDCLAKAAGDKVHAIRIYMHETGTDLDNARKVIESNMVMGW
jgi:hypothetical protein